MKGGTLILVLAVLGFTYAYEGLELPSHFPEAKYDFEQNPFRQEISDLGRQLFYDPILSADNRISCASCHSPFNAFAHTDHELSHGIDDRIGTRNAPALFNLAWSSRFMWDGAIGNLDTQPLAPISHPDEMGDTLPHVLHKLREKEQYRTGFERAFGDTAINSSRMLLALSQFQLSLISAGSKYDGVQMGLKEFSPQEERGYQLFKKNCNSCHKEPLFQSERMTSNGLLVDSSLKDIGLMRFSGNPKDSLKFKVPSLRNLSFTYPYMHDGRFNRLIEVLNHYDGGIVQHPSLGTDLKDPISMNRNEKKDLIAFLLCLNDTAFVFDPRYGFPEKILSNEGKQN